MLDKWGKYHATDDRQLQVYFILVEACVIIMLCMWVHQLFLV